MTTFIRFIVSCSSFLSLLGQPAEDWPSYVHPRGVIYKLVAPGRGQANDLARTCPWMSPEFISLVEED